MSIRANSISSADLPQAIRKFESVRAGEVIAGFRLERQLGRGETGAVYEATQLSLGRAVALRLIDPARYADPEAQARLERELGLASSIHHSGLVPMYEAGKWAGGRFVAMRLIRGGNLGSLRPTGGSLGADMLRSVSAGLEAAHRAGLTHGAVRAVNVLVDRDGRAHLADLGLGRGSGVDADRDGLAAVRTDLGASGSTRRPWKAIAAAGILAIAVAAALLVTRSGEERADADGAAPPAPEGTVALGSDLSPGPAERVGCGRGFGGGSACVLVPADTEGVALRATEPGVIRSWAVRGAAGELTLQVLRPRGAVTRVTGFSQPVAVADAGPQRFSAEIGVERGDLVAVELGPRAALGRRQGDGRALRWASTVLPLPSLAEATPLTGELLVRVDIEPGAEPSAPVQLTGRARAAPAGITLAEAAVAVTPRDAVQVRLVRVGGGIQLDAFRGSRRAARLPVADAHPDGELILFEQACGYPRSVCLRWRNPGDATPLVHAYSVAPSGRFHVIG